MRIRFGFVVLLAFAVLGWSAGDEPKPAHKEMEKQTALDKFKLLVGDWTGSMMEDGKKIDASVSYKLTSGGSTIVETLGAGSPHEMVTIIHPDGDNLLLTHYCAIGNQPTMKAKADGDKVAFEFVRGSNMKSDKDMHMHAVTYTFVDKDTLKAEWVLYNDGKEAGKSVFEFKRKK